MPRVTPILRLTRKQWQKLLERVFKREGRTLGEAAPLVFPYEPPEERLLGRLIRYRDLEGKLLSPREEGVGKLARAWRKGDIRRETIEMPLSEARQEFFARPEEYVPYQQATSAKVLRETPGGPSYAKERVSPILPPSFMKTMKTFRVEGAPFKRIVEDALEAELLWNQVELTMGRPLWRELFKTYMKRATSKKTGYRTPKDYFVGQFKRWKQDPKKFTKSFPREGRLFQTYWSELLERVE